MPLISCVINVDTRPENSKNKEMFNGVVDREFLWEGIWNKKQLFKNFDAEFIVFVDEHEPLTDDELVDLRNISNVLIVRRHDKSFEDKKEFFAFNDLNYLTALFSARGKYIFHFDGDVAAFAPNDSAITALLNGLDSYDYISYPSNWSPNPVHDESFGGKYWVSTRFFCCKRSTIDFSEVLKCQLDYDYWKATYPVPRLCHWTEHLLSSISHHKGNGVYYPPMEYDAFILFTWENYQKGVYGQLQNMSYEEIKNFVLSKGGIQYPNNLTL